MTPAMARKAHTNAAILVTGAGGFVGGALCRHLLRTTRRKIIAVDLRPIDRPDTKRIVAVIGTLTDNALFAELPRQVETIYHLAAAIDTRDAPAMFAANVLATARLLDYARRAATRQFVMASTGGVYGYRPTPARECHPPAPENDYAISKYAAEKLVQHCAGQFNIAILRLFFPYGDGQRGRFIPNLVQRVAQGLPVDIHPDDRPRLNPVHIDDLVAAMAAAAALRGCQLLNIAGRQTVSVRQIAEMIGRRLGMMPHFRPAVGTPVNGHMTGSVARAQSMLNWTPKITLARGLDDVVKNFTRLRQKASPKAERTKS